MAILRTPVLFLTFNRLDTTKKVFAEIRKAKPKQLFIASDGPRKDRPEEKEIVEKIRKYLLKNIDWTCKVKTLFRKKNLGCKYAVSGAIDWFFENVEQGIILEDDCLPNKSFFRFCEELLDKYKYEKRIMHISGTNFIDEKTKDMKESYYFSKNAHIWGWATWKRAWKNYDVEIQDKMTLKDLRKISTGILEYLKNKKRLKELKAKRFSTWDYQWDFTIGLEGGLAIIPKDNLVENIGFGDDATNTGGGLRKNVYLVRKFKEMKFPLSFRVQIKRENSLDRKIISLDLRRYLKRKLF